MKSVDLGHDHEEERVTSFPVVPRLEARTSLRQTTSGRDPLTKDILDRIENTRADDAPSMSTTISARERLSRSIDRERRTSVELPSRTVTNSDRDRQNGNGHGSARDHDQG